VAEDVANPPVLGEMPSDTAALPPGPAVCVEDTDTLADSMGVPDASVLMLGVLVAETLFDADTEGVGSAGAPKLRETDGLADTLPVTLEVAIVLPVMLAVAVKLVVTAALALPV
jgi:hypothetical protein